MRRLVHSISWITLLLMHASYAIEGSWDNGICYWKGHPPITDPIEAQKVCGIPPTKHPLLQWNGKWVTSRDGTISMCGTNAKHDIPASALLKNRQDAEKICPASVQTYIRVRKQDNLKETMVHDDSYTERCRLWAEIRFLELDAPKAKFKYSWKRISEMSCQRRGFFPTFENFTKDLDIASCMKLEGCMSDIDFAPKEPMQQKEKCYLQVRIEYDRLKKDVHPEKDAWRKKADENCRLTGYVIEFKSYIRSQHRKNLDNKNNIAITTLPALTPNTPSVVSAPVNPPESVKETLVFAGYTWRVRSEGSSGPGPNIWDSRNAWVDSNGHLHLKIALRNGQWTTAEVQMHDNQRLGFGMYQWQILGRPDQLPQNVVLGLYNYPRADIGSDGTNEIDIEFTTWNLENPEHGNWTVWPSVPVQRIDDENDPRRSWYVYMADLLSNQSTHRFTWGSHSVFFESLNGFIPHTSHESVYKSWRFSPPDPLSRIPQKPLPVHMNLWLVEGLAPKNHQEIEVIITDFKFIPTGSLKTPASPAQ